MWLQSLTFVAIFELVGLLSYLRGNAGNEYGNLLNSCTHADFSGASEKLFSPDEENFSRALLSMHSDHITLKMQHSQRVIVTGCRVTVSLIVRCAQDRIADGN